MKISKVRTHDTQLEEKLKIVERSTKNATWNTKTVNKIMIIDHKYHYNILTEARSTWKYYLYESIWFWFEIQSM